MFGRPWAPFAGMTQTGSVGMISAGQSPAPQPCLQIEALGACPGKGFIIAPRDGEPRARSQAEPHASTNLPVFRRQRQFRPALKQRAQRTTPLDTRELRGRDRVRTSMDARLD